jgi:hypothetical protein
MGNCMKVGSTNKCCDVDECDCEDDDAVHKDKIIRCSYRLDCGDE